MSDAVRKWENSHVDVYSDKLVELGNAMQAEFVARIAEMEADHDSVASAYDERYSELIEARATIERLKVCGSCRHCKPQGYWPRCYAETPYETVDMARRTCKLTPSRWAEGNTP